MDKSILFILVILICGVTIIAHSCQELKKNREPSDYFSERQQLIKNESDLSLGGKLQLNPIETRANEVLITAKNREMHDGFIRDYSFLPSQNFMKVISKIENSEVFKILHDLPKGAILHAHDLAIVSVDYKLYNLTYRENMYMCDKNNSLQLKFFDTPDDECEWRLLSEVRQDPDRAREINERIRKSLTMITDDPNSEYDTVNKAWVKFSSIFLFMQSWIFYRPVYEDHLYRGFQEFYDDNVMHLELRTTLSPLYDFNGTEYGPIETAQVHKEVVDRFLKDHPDFIDIKLIYAPLRAVDEKRVDYYMETMAKLTKLFPDFVVGFDLVGQEDKGQPLIDFANALNAASPGIQFFFHAGETNWNGQPTDLNLFDAFLLNTKRIGHGYALTKHPLLLKFARQRKIAIEICPISNQVLGLVRDMRNHPATSLFALGSPVVVSNDDPGLWGASGLTYDFYEAFMGLMSASSDLRSLKQLAKNSLIYSSLNDSQKNDALAKWKVRWNAWVAKLAELSPNNNNSSSHSSTALSKIITFSFTF